MDPSKRPANVSRHSTPQELEATSRSAGFTDVRVRTGGLWVTVVGAGRRRDAVGRHARPRGGAANRTQRVFCASAISSSSIRAYCVSAASRVLKYSAWVSFCLRQSKSKIDALAVRFERIAHHVLALGQGEAVGAKVLDDDPRRRLGGRVEVDVGVLELAEQDLLVEQRGRAVPRRDDHQLGPRQVHRRDEPARDRSDPWWRCTAAWPGPAAWPAPRPAPTTSTAWRLRRPPAPPGRRRAPPPVQSPWPFVLRASPPLSFCSHSSLLALTR